MALWVWSAILGRSSQVLMQSQKDDARSQLRTTGNECYAVARREPYLPIDTLYDIDYEPAILLSVV